MERLTIRNNVGLDVLKSPVVCGRCGEVDYSPITESGEDVAKRLAAYEDKIPFDRLDEAAALVKAGDEGRAVVLPCKPSDVTVYQLRGKKHALGVGISPRHISATTVWANGNYALHHQGADDCLKKDFGKTWFLSSVEADAALAMKP